ncbi:hypothetical protein KAI04_02760 [Candidatus Pacearchaeota archaeon]|nr:hypothetical protein [Candidatus Pacearchaeota archaeon]
MASNKNQIYKSNVKGSESKSVRSFYKGFEIKEKVDFAKLDNLEGEFTRLTPLLKYNQTNPQETIVYSSDSAVIVISANHSTNYHGMEIVLKDCKGECSEAINALKSKLETKLETKLKDIPTSTKKLIDEIGKN